MEMMKKARPSHLKKILRRNFISQRRIWDVYLFFGGI